MSSNNKQKKSIANCLDHFAGKAEIPDVPLSRSHSLSTTLVLPLSLSLSPHASYNWQSRTKQNTKKKRDNLKQQQHRTNNNNNAWKISKASKKLITNWTEK